MSDAAVDAPTVDAPMADAPGWAGTNASARPRLDRRSMLVVGGVLVLLATLLA